MTNHIIQNLDPNSAIQVQMIRASTSDGLIGGGYNSAKQIPANEGSLYSKLSDEHRSLVDQAIDNKITQVLRGSSLPPAKREIENHVHHSREELAPHAEILEQLKSQEAIVSQSSKNPPTLQR